MRNRPPRLFELLVVSLLSLLLGLAGLAVIVGRSSSALSHVDRVIVGDAVPSVLALQSAGVKLGELQGLLRDRLRGPLRDRELLEADIAAKRRELGDTIHAYYQLPIDPGEEAARAQIDAGLGGLDRLTDHIVRLTGRPPELTEQLARVLEEQVLRLNGALLMAASINAEVLTNASARLRTVSTWVLPSALVLEVLCFLAAALTLAAAYRVVRSSERSHEARRHLLEQRMVELDTFSGRVAHDLLSPLMTVSLALGAVEPHVAGAEDRRAQRLVTRARGSLQRVRETVSDLLEFARAGATPQPEAKAEAQAVLEEVVDELEPIAEVASVELVVEGRTARAVRCSAGVLRSVLGNLVQNAIKYIEGGEARRVTARVADDGEQVRFEVEDTGPGIPLADQRRIFDPYVRGSETGAGLGLGLATVKRLAEAHGGQVGVRSEVGHGACFWLTLPGVTEGRA